MENRIRYYRTASTTGLVLSDARVTSFRFERHFHLEHHIGLIAQGCQRQAVRGESVVLTPGQVCFMPAGETHDGLVEGSQPYVLKTFRIAPQLLDEIVEQVYEGRSSPRMMPLLLDDPGLAHGLLSLHAQLEAGRDIADSSMQAGWLNAIAGIMSHSDPTNQRAAVTGALSRPHWNLVHEYCHAHLGEKITLEGLAQLCGMSRFQFLRQFTRRLGITPHAWLLRFRLERSLQLLGSGTSRIADVALDLGFYDQSHFDRAFKRAYGVTPSSY